jgi:alpha-ribazole phosphatase
MSSSEMPGTELMLIRHAPAATEGRLCGRTDVPLCRAALPDLAALRARTAAARRISSPARRCRETAAALWPDGAADIDAQLVEQDFGEWDGLALADLPDLGPLPRAALAAHRPPAGESFRDLCDRVRPALAALAAASGPAAVVTHAGVVRAALALALDDAAAAMAFELAPLSLTRLRALAPDTFAILCVNCEAG